MAMTLIAKIVFFLKKKFLSCRYFCLFAQIKHLLATIVTYRFLHSCVGTQGFFCIFAKKYKIIMLRKNILFMVLLLGIALTARAQANEQIQLHHVNTKGYAVRVCYRDAALSEKSRR